MTIVIAHQLYEGIDVGSQSGGITGLITYMRTDSTRISPVARGETVKYIEEKFGENYVGYRKSSKQSEGAQDAHEAIRPTSIHRTPASLKSVLSNDQYRLYKLIYERFLASQMAPAVMDTMTVQLTNNGVEFRATGSQVKFPGFMRVYKIRSGKQDKDKILPELEKGMAVKAKEITPNQHFTQPQIGRAHV